MKALSTFTRPIMSWHSIADQWESFRGRLQERWSRLSEAELDRVDGRRELFLRLLAERYGLDPQQAEALVVEWQKDVFEEAPTQVIQPVRDRRTARSH